MSRRWEFSRRSRLRARLITAQLHQAFNHARAIVNLRSLDNLAKSAVRGIQDCECGGAARPGTSAPALPQFPTRAGERRSGNPTAFLRRPRLKPRRGDPAADQGNEIRHGRERSQCCRTCPSRACRSSAAAARAASRAHCTDRFSSITPSRRENLQNKCTGVLDNLLHGLYRRTFCNSRIHDSLLAAKPTGRLDPDAGSAKQIVSLSWSSE